MGTFFTLRNVIFMWNDWKMESAMRKNVFLHSKTGPASVWIDSENYSTTCAASFVEQLLRRALYGLK